MLVVTITSASVSNNVLKGAASKYQRSHPKPVLRGNSMSPPRSPPQCSLQLFEDWQQPTAREPAVGYKLIVTKAEVQNDREIAFPSLLHERTEQRRRTLLRCDTCVLFTKSEVYISTFHEFIYLYARKLLFLVRKHDT